MSLRDDAQYVYGPTIEKFIPLHPDGSTALPYPGKTENAAFSGLGTFDFSGVDDSSAVPMTIKIDDSEETIDLDFVTTAPADISAVTVTEFIAVVTAAGFTGITASVDSRGYGKLLTAGDPETEYLQVYGEAALIADFGQGYGAKLLTCNTQQSFSLSPVNVDDETIEVRDSNAKKTSIIIPGYRDGVTGAFTETAVDDELVALLTGGSYDSDNKEYLPPLPDADRPLISLEVANKIYLKDKSQAASYIGVKLTRAFTMSAKQDATGDGGEAFQTGTFSFNGTAYTIPDTTTKIPDSMTKEYTTSEWEALGYEDL